jgi:hypothetical protein
MSNEAAATITESPPSQWRKLTTSSRGNSGRTKKAKKKSSRGHREMPAVTKNLSRSTADVERTTNAIADKTHREASDSTPKARYTNPASVGMMGFK